MGITLILTVFLYAFRNTFSEKTTSSIWDGTIATSFSSGTGTSSDPYIITNGSELAYFIKLINSDNSSEYFNKYYEINNNINLDGREFSFASANKQFSGVLNGGGYTISNFKISEYYTDLEETTASFSFMSSLYNSDIKNINFKDVNFIVNDRMVSKDYEEKKSEDDELENAIVNIDISLFKDVENSSITNINANNIIIEYKGDTEVLNSSLFILNDNGSNDIENINITGDSNVESTNILLGEFNGSNLKNIMFESSKLSLVDEFDYTKKYDIYEYSIEKDKVVFTNSRDLEYALKVFNENSDLVWKYEDGEFRIINNGVSAPEKIISHQK